MTAKARVLVIEDEAPQMLLVRTGLERQGFDVLWARDGIEGLRMAREQLPDLILLDIILPGMDGVQVCRELKDAPDTGRIPVIMVTASSMRSLSERVKTFGVDACLIKPYELRDLLAVVERLLASSQARPKAST
jgi:DNA-binding response OmpR family regulator